MTPLAHRRARRRFQRFYPGGFADPDYIALERDYKWAAHRAWSAALGPEQLARALAEGTHREAASAAVRIESRTNLLFSFEKMALRDAVASDAGSRQLIEGLHHWLHGPGREQERFERWVEVVRELPRRQTRVLTWPVATVFGFIARPRAHLFLKPVVTRTAAERLGQPFDYHSAVTWSTYSSLLELAASVKAMTRDWKPRDLIDVQSFLWVQGSAEYD